MNCISVRGIGIIVSLDRKTDYGHVRVLEFKANALKLLYNKAD